MGNIHSRRQLNMMVKWSQPSLLTLVCLYKPTLYLHIDLYVLKLPRCDFLSCSFFARQQRLVDPLKFVIPLKFIIPTCYIGSYLIDYVGGSSDRFLFNLRFFSFFSHFFKHISPFSPPNS
jgi:hypothetical protein